MNFKLKKTLYVFIFMCMTVLFSRCQTDEIESNYENPDVTNTKSWFENNNINLEVIKYTKIIDWNNAILIDEHGRKAIEVPLILMENTLTNVVKDKDYKTNMRLLFIEDKEQNYQVFVINYTTKNKSYNNKEFNLYKTGTEYSGYITVQNAENKIVYSGKYENGEQLSLHNYGQAQNTNNRYVCRYYITVGPHTTCNSWSWYPDNVQVGLPPGYMPGISGPIWSSNILINTPDQAKKILNRQDYLKNFNLSMGGTLHVYVDQPISNSSVAYSGMVNPDVGHTFIAIEQDQIVRVIGFYPSNGVNPFTSPSASPSYLNDSAHPYDVKIFKALSSSQLSNVISNIINYNIQYDLNTNNCSDFAQQIASSGGLQLPNTNGSWPGGGGTNPGNLGQDIRNMSLSSGATVKTTGGIALTNSN
jgi:hypothetical protein